MIEVPAITTARLILKPLELADADAVQRVFPQWEIVRLMASHILWPYPSDGALTFVRDTALPAMRAGQEWHWSIRPKESPMLLIGVISLMDKPDQPDDNRGFWLDPVWQKKGLMSEACVPVTKFWFETLRRPVLRAPKAITNTPSRRISERMGMRIVKTEKRPYVSGILAAEIWEITREEWRDSGLVET
ncbi:MAG TPA: GNAT family N-acetyltransferase [Beijerinckiaceae bacterium]|nr:GNAT family N-acetyltransferase [Beijerinckiaceae bacterium]